MRPTWILTLLVGMAIALSGCADDEEPCEGEDCPDQTTTTTTTTDGGNTTTTQPPTPNEPPVVQVTVTDDAGNTTRAVLKGGNLTFDGSGSTDPDGTIQDMAIVIQDDNGTRPAVPLLRNGQYQTATFGFFHTGVVNVTISALDDAGAITRHDINVYVNEVQMSPSHDLRIPNPAGDPTQCQGTANDAIVDTPYYKEFTFEVKSGAQWVEADLVSGGGTSMAICSPDGTALSDAGSDRVETDEGVNLTADLNYYVAVFLTGSAGESVQVAMTVHYDPRTTTEMTV